MNKQQYRVRNWSDYNKALVNRGSITFWFNEKAINDWHQISRTGKRGRPKVYTDTAMECLFMLKAVFKLPFRNLEGFVSSLKSLAQWPLVIPSYSQICRRQQGMTIDLSASSKNSAIHVVVDSTGLKVFGEGEWKVRQHGYSKRRTWRKLHLAIDESSGEIVASGLSTNDVTDGEMLSDLLDDIESKINCVGADGAYDIEPCYQAIDKHQAKANIPPRKDAVLKQHGNTKGPPLTRDQNIRAIKKMGRSAWKRSVGYHRRSLAETAMFRFKTLFGNALSNRLFEHQTTEAFIKCHVMNKMTQLGMPDSVPI